MQYGIYDLGFLHFLHNREGGDELRNDDERCDRRRRYFVGDTLNLDIPYISFEYGRCDAAFDSSLFHILNKIAEGGGFEPPKPDGLPR